MEMELSDLPRSGIVTLRNWLMSSDGDRYLYLFSNAWFVLIDKDVPIRGFHSRERWSLCAEGTDNNIVAMIPGCEVCGFIKTEKCPEHTLSSPHKADEPDFLPGIFNLTVGKGFK